MEKSLSFLFRKIIIFLDLLSRKFYPVASNSRHKKAIQCKKSEGGRESCALSFSLPEVKPFFPQTNTAQLKHTKHGDAEHSYGFIRFMWQNFR